MNLPDLRLTTALILLIVSGFQSSKLCAQPMQPSSADSPSTRTIEGYWLGTLSAPGVSLRIQITVKRNPEQGLSCTLDSLDQGAMGLPCANVALTGDELTFDVKPVGGHYSGKLAADGQTLSGTW